MQIESKSCNLCGSNELHQIYKTGDKIWLIGGDFYLVKCAKCGLVFVNPRPVIQDMGEFYPAKYYSRTFGTIKLTDQYSLEVKRVFNNRFHPVPLFKDKGAALEIGCSDGYFLNFLKEKGWQVEGIEPSQFASDYARSAFGLNVFTGTLDSFVPKENTFDMVYMFEVFEHLHDPRGTLIKIKSMLKEDGVLVITVPNFSSLLRRLFGKSWHFIDLPRHLFHFTKKSIKGMLKEAGFKSLSISTVSNICYSNPSVGYSESLRVWLRDHNLYPPKTIPTDSQLCNANVDIFADKKKPVWKKILHGVENIIYNSIARMADKVGLGENLYIVAGKIDK